MTFPHCLLVREVMLCVATHHPFLPGGTGVGRKPSWTSKSLRKSAEGMQAVAWFPHPAGSLWEEKRRNFSFLDSDMACWAWGWGVSCVLIGGGEKGKRQQFWKPAVTLQVSCKYLEMLLWQEQTYCSACGWWKGKDFLRVLTGTLWTLCNLGIQPWLLEKKVSLEGKSWPVKVWRSSHQLVLMSHPARPSLLYLNVFITFPMKT